MSIKRSAIFLAAVFVTACNPYRGSLESEFRLSDSSPLPVWVDPLPEGYERNDVEIILQYWTPYFDVDNTVLMVKSKGSTLVKKTGRSKEPADWSEWAHQDWPKRLYPAYSYLTIDGITEVVEHRKLEPIFYISGEQAIEETMQGADGKDI